MNGMYQNSSYVVDLFMEIILYDMHTIDKMRERKKEERGKEREGENE